MRILNAALCLSEDLEVPFPKVICLKKADQSCKTSDDISNSNDIEKTADCEGEGTAEEIAVKTGTAAENPYDESIPLKLEHIKINVCFYGRASPYFYLTKFALPQILGRPLLGVLKVCIVLGLNPLHIYHFL